MTHPSAPITTADMLALLRRNIASMAFNEEIYRGEPTSHHLADACARDVAIYTALLARLEQQEQAAEILRQIILASDECQGHRECNHSMTPWRNARLFLSVVDNEEGWLGGVSAPVVAPQPETPARSLQDIVNNIGGAQRPAPAVEIAPPAHRGELTALVKRLRALPHLTDAVDLLGVRCSTLPPTSVSVEALRALPRYRVFSLHDCFDNPDGDWVKWSDLAALWPPQTGTET